MTKQTTAAVVSPPTGPGLSLRTQNLRAALQHVYREGVTSRADLSRLTGLTRATVSTLVSRLVDDDLVRETGVGTSSGGKPPTLLELNPGGRTIVAIDLSRRPFGGALVDLSGRIHHRATGGRSGARGRQGLRDVFRLADRLVAEAPSPVLGVGVGTPGIVDRDGAVVEASNLGWHGVPLRRELAERLERPVTVANDAHVGALAELGAHPDGNLVLVKVGLGIGAGIVVDGRLHLGDRPAAGEIGHIRVVERGASCRCGNRGCLETVASVPSIIGAALRSAGRDPEDGGDLPWDADELAAAIGKTAVGRAVERAGRHVGAVLAHLVAILDIHRIVVAFELSGASDPFLEAIAGEIGKRVLPDLAPVVELSASETGADLVLSGAAALVLRQQLGVSWR
ncbi:MAG TPA: ROK family transcriptional regulator [Actinomycetota bacterium]|nr:ROK family transcriptional regulator [Actinomycetota bacterium]